MNDLITKAFGSVTLDEAETLFKIVGIAMICSNGKVNVLIQEEEVCK